MPEGAFYGQEGASWNQEGSGMRVDRQLLIFVSDKENPFIAQCNLPSPQVCSSCSPPVGVKLHQIGSRISRVQRHFSWWRQPYECRDFGNFAKPKRRLSCSNVVCSHRQIFSSLPKKLNQNLKSCVFCMTKPMCFKEHTSSFLKRILGS
jgi:hypothetical protein